MPPATGGRSLTYFGPPLMIEFGLSGHSHDFIGALQLLVDTPGAEEGIVLAIGSMGAGSNHDHANNSPLLFRGTNFINATNRQISLPGTPLANLHVTLLKAFGVEGQFGAPGVLFGDYGTSEIPGILAEACGQG